MKGRLGRVAVLASVLALAVTASVTGSAAGASEEASPQQGAALVQQSHDALKAAADAGDVAATKAVLDDLQPLLTELESGQRYALKDSSRELAATAGDDASQASEQVNQLFPDDASQTDGTAEKVGLPSVAELLNVLVQRLLLSLSVLVNDLLGSGLPLLPA
jgi:hypothetical protein